MHSLIGACDTKDFEGFALQIVIVDEELAQMIDERFPQVVNMRRMTIGNRFRDTSDKAVANVL